MAAPVRVTQTNWSRLEPAAPLIMRSVPLRESANFANAPPSTFTPWRSGTAGPVVSSDFRSKGAASTLPSVRTYTSWPRDV